MRIEIPALFAVGSRDVGLAMPGMDQIIADMPGLVPRLRDSVIIEGAGHWIQQERPEKVNELILAFASTLGDPEDAVS
ncbi:alpha/beta hydrolase [Leclercia pneumoniae]|nr:alpha/beta hydrolase [Leclercia pneumoniae]MEB7499435.1 alpha/beta hydrolase [Leclercia pneumoniae]